MSPRALSETITYAACNFTMKIHWEYGRLARQLRADQKIFRPHFQGYFYPWGRSEFNDYDRFHYLLCLLALLCLILVPDRPAFAENPDPIEDAMLREESLFLSPIMFYQKFISPVDGGRCLMTPSCSAYSKEAFNAHGFFFGWIMTCDRLMRCGRDETQLSPGILTPDGRLTLDPLSGNDSWMK